MTLNELRSVEVSEEAMEWVYLQIKEAYENEQEEVRVNYDSLTGLQCTHLKGLGYTVLQNYDRTTLTISGWRERYE